MSWYGDHVFPRVLDRALDTAETRRIRAEVCAPLRGDVLEIGRRRTTAGGGPRIMGWMYQGVASAA
jgi:hypothetical protein